MVIALANDHAGFRLKNAVKSHLQALGLKWEDFGSDSEDSVDYPDFACKAAAAVSHGRCERGILVCGSGIGMSMVANRFPRVRAALCTSPDMARLARQHNDANVLVLAGRLLDERVALEIVDVWLDTEFEGGRHARRVEKIHRLTGV